MYKSLILSQPQRKELYEDDFQACFSCAAPDLLDSLNSTGLPFPGNEIVPETKDSGDKVSKDGNQLLGN